MILVQCVLICCLMPDNHTDFVLKVNFECLRWKSLLFLLLYITFSERQRKVKIGSLNTSSFPSNRIVRFLRFFLSWLILLYRKCLSWVTFLSHGCHFSLDDAFFNPKYVIKKCWNWLKYVNGLLHFCIPST